MQRDKISVIVPVYNVEAYLSKCIESIIHQTYQNLEILLIDDGSTDGSGPICDAFAEKDARITVIHKKNGGLSDARNTGINHSSGEYLAFVDSDDSLDLHMLEKLYAALKEHDADISICDFCRVDSDGNNYEDGQSNFHTCAGLATGKEVIQRLFEGDYTYYTVAWNKLYKREIFKNIRYPYGRLNEDEFVVHRIFGACKKVVCLNDQLYYYLQRPDGIMGILNSGSRKHRFFNRADALLDRSEYLDSIGMPEYASEAYARCVFLFLRICDTEVDEKNNGCRRQSKVKLAKNRNKQNSSVQTNSAQTNSAHTNSAQTNSAQINSTQNRKDLNKKIKVLRRKLLRSFGLSKYAKGSQRIRLLAVCMVPHLYLFCNKLKEKIR